MVQWGLFRVICHFAFHVGVKTTREVVQRNYEVQSRPDQLRLTVRIKSVIRLNINDVFRMRTCLTTFEWFYNSLVTLYIQHTLSKEIKPFNLLYIVLSIIHKSK